MWIEGYTKAVKFLYEKLVEEEIIWTEEDENRFEELKQKFVSAPTLSLPPLKKPFHSFVNVDNRMAHGVLTQDWGGSRNLWHTCLSCWILLAGDGPCAFKLWQLHH